MTIYTFSYYLDWYLYLSPYIIRIFLLGYILAMIKYNITVLVIDVLGGIVMFVCSYILYLSCGVASTILLFTFVRVGSVIMPALLDLLLYQIWPLRY